MHNLTPISAAFKIHEFNKQIDLNKKCTMVAMIFNKIKQIEQKSYHIVVDSFSPKSSFQYIHEITKKFVRKEILKLLRILSCNQ